MTNGVVFYLKKIKSIGKRYNLTIGDLRFSERQHPVQKTVPIIEMVLEAQTGVPSDEDNRSIASDDVNS